jgi:hypothetical protein
MILQEQTEGTITGQRRRELAPGAAPQSEVQPGSSSLSAGPAEIPLPSDRDRQKLSIGFAAWCIRSGH